MATPVIAPRSDIMDFNTVCLGLVNFFISKNGLHCILQKAKTELVSRTFTEPQRRKCNAICDITVPTLRFLREKKKSYAKNNNKLKL